MKYQLVLQWPASSIKDYDMIVEIENVLRDKLSQIHDVDGHDAGSGEANIFILTDEPQRAFFDIQQILGTRDFWTDARVAYRNVTKDDYTILWPKGLLTFKVS